MNRLRSVLFVSSLLLIGLGVSATPGCQSDDGGVTDTNTNWLRPCDNDDVCGDLACRCGVCTEACTSNLDCAPLGANAVCAKPEGDACGSLSCLATQSSPDTDTDDTDDSASPDDTDDVMDDSVGDDDDLTDDAAGPDGTDDANSDDANSDDANSDDANSDDATPDDQSPDDVCIGTPILCADLCGNPQDAVCMGELWVCPEAGDVTCATDGGASSSDASTSDDPNQESGTDDSAVDDATDDADAGTTDVPGSACDMAVDGEPCAVEGERCGGACTDTCSFCNLTLCSGGIWTRLEAFPAPCFDCGDGLRCDPTRDYCQLDGNVFSCETLPEDCASDTSCECLEGAISGGACVEDESGSGFIVDLGSLPMSTQLCSCTVFPSASGWCSPDGGFVEEGLPVEWVCGGPETPRDALLAECVSLPTSADRWCCPNDFAPECTVP